jgi:hypothetical protein
MGCVTSLIVAAAHCIVCHALPRIALPEGSRGYVGDDALIKAGFRSALVQRGLDINVACVSDMQRFVAASSQGSFVASPTRPTPAIRPASGHAMTRWRFKAAYFLFEAMQDGL